MYDIIVIHRYCVLTFKTTLNEKKNCGEMCIYIKYLHVEVHKLR